jgi:hypothetical protein
MTKSSVESLFKQYPWINDLHPLMSKVTHVQVWDLAPDNIQETQCGMIRGVEHPYDSYGFFIGFGGKTVSEVHPPGSDFRHWNLFKKKPIRFVTGKLNDERSSHAQTIEQAGRILSPEDKNSVRFVVVLRMMLNNPDSIPLTFIKVNENFKLIDVLAYLDTTRRTNENQVKLFN